MMRILVTGSRTWDDDALVHEVFRGVDWEFDLGAGRAVIVHGGANGADRICQRVGYWRGWQDELHKAEWEKHGKRAGYVRNAEMVAAGADLCLAFIKDASRGATMTADLAEKAGIPVRRFAA